jgi:hypothetical protein
LALFYRKGQKFGNLATNSDNYLAFKILASKKSAKKVPI